MSGSRCIARDRRGAVRTLTPATIRRAGLETSGILYPACSLDASLSTLAHLYPERRKQHFGGPSVPDLAKIDEDAERAVHNIGYAHSALKDVGVICLLVVAGAGWSGYRTFGAGGFRVGYLPVVFVSGVAAMFLVPLTARAIWRASRGRPLLTLTASGVVLHSAGVRLPWSNVAEIQIIHRVGRHRRTDIVVFVPVDPGMALHGLRGRARWFARDAVRRVGGPILVRVGSMRSPLPEVLNTIRALTSAPIRHKDLRGGRSTVGRTAARPVTTTRQRIGSAALTLSAAIAFVAQPLLAVALISLWLTPYSKQNPACGAEGTCTDGFLWSATAALWVGMLVIEFAAAMIVHRRARAGLVQTRWPLGRRIKATVVAGSAVALAVLLQGGILRGLADHGAAARCETATRLERCSSGTDAVATGLFVRWNTMTLATELTTAFTTTMLTLAILHTRRRRATGGMK